MTETTSHSSSPTLTSGDVVSSKPVPVIVRSWPPAVLPSVGEIPVTSVMGQQEMVTYESKFTTGNNDLLMYVHNRKLWLTSVCLEHEGLSRCWHNVRPWQRQCLAVRCVNNDGDLDIRWDRKCRNFASKVAIVGPLIPQTDSVTEVTI